MVYVGGFPPRVKNPEIRSFWGGIRKIRKSARLGPLCNLLAPPTGAGDGWIGGACRSLWPHGHLAPPLGIAETS